MFSGLPDEGESVVVEELLLLRHLVSLNLEEFSNLTKHEWNLTVNEDKYAKGRGMGQGRTQGRV